MAVTVVHHTTIDEIRRESTKDQYSEVALLYDELIGSVDQRTYEYKHFFGDILRKNGCVKVLDVACGTGVDSILLLEQGFKLVSTDASDEMLEFAKKAKLLNGNNPRYKDDGVIIKKANWNTLTEDMESLRPDDLFDAVICLANSFSHIYNKRGQKECLSNFAKCLKPGGILLIDHRNYDAIIDGHPAPKYNAYYNYKQPIDTKTSVHLVGDKPELVAFDVKIKKTSFENVNRVNFSEFRLWYYPHRLTTLTQMLNETFDNRAEHQIYGDFKPLGEVPVPGYYLHVVKKPEY